MGGVQGDLPPGTSLVEIELEPRDGGTLVRLRHSSLPVPMPEMHRERWERYPRSSSPPPAS